MDKKSIFAVINTHIILYYGEFFNELYGTD